MEIRPAAAADELEAVGALTVEAYGDLYGKDGLGDYATALADAAGRAADSVVLVALSGGEVVGAVTYVPDSQRAMSEFQDPEAAGIRMLAVRPGAQGRGTGRALVVACIARAEAEGKARVVLHSTEAMVVARGMYARLGFVERPELDVYIEEDERSFRLIALSLELPRPPD